MRNTRYASLAARKFGFSIIVEGRAKPSCHFVHLILLSSGPKVPKSGPFKNEGIHEFWGASRASFLTVFATLLVASRKVASKDVCIGMWSRFGNGRARATKSLAFSFFSKFQMARKFQRRSRGPRPGQTGTAPHKVSPGWDFREGAKFPAPGFEFPARDQIRLSNSLQDRIGNSAKRPRNISALAIHLPPDFVQIRKNSLHFPC